MAFKGNHAARSFGMARGQDTKKAKISMIFAQPYGNLSPSQLLEHFHHRPSIRFTPQVEAEHLQKKRVDEVLVNTFTFNHERHRLSEPIAWLNNPSRDIEWLILLHKCYYFVGLGLHYRRTGDLRYRDRWVELTESWIEQVPPGFIASDVTGRRVQNWIFAFYYFIHSHPFSCVSGDFLLRFLQSLHEQVDYLIRHLTPARNHRTLELYTIFLAAVVFPEFRDAKKWLEFSITALTENAQNDILSDGVHCELSTFYHHTVLKNFLAVKQLAVDNHIGFPPAFDRQIQKALEFSLWVHKPDGAIPSLSDGDPGSFHELLKQGYQLYGGPCLQFAVTGEHSGQPPKRRSRWFPEGGYAIVRGPWESAENTRDGHYLIFDCGPLGAGNHGHLDVLNIELAGCGRSLIVDPGRYTYDESGGINWRARFRGTAAHNTVEVDGKNQARYQYSPRHGKYRILGAHPEPALRTFVTTCHFDFVHGQVRSDEYPAIHHRTIFFAVWEYWLICDFLKSDLEHDYYLRFHLHPNACGKVTTKSTVQGHFSDSPNLLVVQTGTQAGFRMDEGWFSPRYGVKYPVPVLRYDLHGRQALFQTLLFPWASHPPKVSIKPLPSGREECSAFRCRLSRAGQVIDDYFFLCHGAGEGCWQCDDIQFQGRFGFLRLDQAGCPRHAFTLAGGRLFYQHQRVSTEGEQP